LGGDSANDLSRVFGEKTRDLRMLKEGVFSLRKSLSKLHAQWRNPSRIISVERPGKTEKLLTLAVRGDLPHFHVLVGTTHR